jgi:Ca2+-binding RTX toxin-like protein
MAISQIKLDDRNDNFDGSGDDSGDPLLIFGAGGNDTLRGGYGDDTIHGDAGNDWLYGYGEGGVLFGGEGDDTLQMFTGTRAEGGTGNDTYDLTWNLMDDTEIIEAAGAAGGVDTILLHGKAERSYTMAANVEKLVVTGVHVGGYIDGLIFGSGDDWTDGAFRADVRGAAGITIEANGSDNTVFGSDRRDTIRGLGGNDSLHGGASNDTMHGNAGNDTLEGGSGDDRLDGSEGDDSVSGGSGADQLWGSGGNDTLHGGGGSDTLQGGAGNDTYVIDASADTIVEAANGGTDTVLTTRTAYTLQANLENLVFQAPNAATGNGNALGNTIIGQGGADSLSGFGGADALVGNGGADTLVGGEGSDWLAGGVGADRLLGGIGNDTIAGGEDGDFAFGGEGDDAIQGDAGADLLRGEGGRDSVTGGTGNDTLQGGAGRDTLRGGEGDDRLFGEGGSDLLYGDAGADRFCYVSTSDSTGSERDWIYGFERGVDRIDLASIDANIGVSGNQAFAFTGAGNVFKGAGELWLTRVGAGTLVQADVGGDGMPDLQFYVVGVWDLAASDFAL